IAPLLRFVGDKLAEVGRRTLKDRYAQGGKPRLDLGISEGGIDFLVELVDDLGRRLLGNASRWPRSRAEIRRRSGRPTKALDALRWSLPARVVCQPQCTRSSQAACRSRPAPARQEGR